MRMGVQDLCLPLPLCLPPTQALHPAGSQFTGASRAGGKPFTSTWGGTPFLELLSRVKGCPGTLNSCQDLANPTTELAPWVSRGVLR